MKKKKISKETIRRKLNELALKYTRYYDLSEESYANEVEYEFLGETRLLVGLFVCIGLAIVLYFVLDSWKAGLGVAFGGSIAFVFMVFLSNRQQRKVLREGGSANIIVCFYTQKLLDEICAQIAKVDKALEPLEREYAEKEAEVKAQSEQSRKEASIEKDRMLMKFDILFDIICAELEGEVRDHYLTTKVVDVKLPVVNGMSLSFQWHKFFLNVTDLNALTFCVAQLQPAMERYHSLQQSLDAVVLVEQ